MIHQSSTHIILGLRPSDSIEKVEITSGLTSFVSHLDLVSNPSNVELSVFNPSDLPFAARDKSFLSILRSTRLAALLSARKRKSSSKGLKNGSPSKRSSPKRRAKALSTALSEQLSLIDPILAEQLKASLAGLSPRTRSKKG